MSPRTPRENRPRALVVGTINRPDLLHMFDSVVGSELELVFVEYADNWGEPIDPEHYRRYGRVTAWEEHGSADLLLDDTCPTLVVMLFITSLNQVALRAAARRRGIPVAHLDHGYRLPSDQYEAMVAPDARSARRSGELLSLVRGYTFFLRSTCRRDGLRLARYALDVMRNGVSRDVQRRHAGLRRADCYISYSPECFAAHMDFDDLHPGTDVRFVGVPSFDDYVERPGAEADASAALLIDHQLHNSGLLGWTAEYRREWAATLLAVVSAAGLRLQVKLHPGDRSDVWDVAVADGLVQIVESEQLPTVGAHTPTVLGTFSTMQLPLAGLQHTTLITLEMHPDQSVFPSRRIVDSGAAVAAWTFDELAELLAKRDALRAEQAPHKQAFVTQFLHRLDGGSGARLRDVLLELSRRPISGQSALGA